MIFKLDNDFWMHWQTENIEHVKIMTVIAEPWNFKNSQEITRFVYHQLHFRVDSAGWSIDQYQILRLHTTCITGKHRD